MNDEFLTCKQLSSFLKLSQASIRRRVRTKTIPFIRIGRSLRFRKKDIEEWLESGGTKVRCIELEAIGGVNGRKRTKSLSGPDMGKQR